MTLDEEIAAVEEVVHAARSAASEHLERAAKDLHLEGAALTRYRDFLDATIVNVQSALTRSREVAAGPASSTTTLANTVQGILAGVRESVRLMYVAMTVVENLAGAAHPSGPAQQRPAPRACSFCGKNEAETKLCAGPKANICASCTRLACGVLGISTSS